VGGSHDVVHQTDRVGQSAGAVDETSWGVPGPPAAVAVGFENVGLQLDADLGRVPELLPLGDRLLQSMAAGDLVGLAVEAEVPDHDTGVRVVPAGANLIGFEPAVDIWQAVEQEGAGGRDHAAVITQTEGGHAVVGAFGGEMRW